jgi:putative restriction endonuclease
MSKRWRLPAGLRLERPSAALSRQDQRHVGFIPRDALPRRRPGSSPLTPSSRTSGSKVSSDFRPEPVEGPAALFFCLRWRTHPVMTVISEEFDRPLLKVLAHNDTGQAVGHQAGFVIPKDLESYFPQLSQNVTPASPTTSEDITASLFDGPNYIGDVSARYQYQTWGGTRPPERRLTNNLSELRNLAERDDILMIERGLEDQSRYRLTLIRQTNPNYAALRAALGAKRWGPLDKGDPPVRETAIISALEEQTVHETQPFESIDHNAPSIEQRTTKIARSKAFQRRLMEIYQGKCAICANALARQDGRTEAEAAHIIPRSVKGADDARNGILLCRMHHWAFDNGLIGIADDLTVIVPLSSTLIPANAALAGFAGANLVIPTNPSLAPHVDAVRWHRTNFNIL